MRLLAIVNRFDLRSTGNAGEGRFVFGVLDAAGNPMQFTVILEYKLPAANAAAVQTWANDWHALGALALGSAAYRTKLQQITHKFSKRGAFPGRPNDSAISQVRSNEIALAFPWELRELHLTTTGQLGRKRLHPPRNRAKRLRGNPPDLSVRVARRMLYQRVCGRFQSWSSRRARRALPSREAGRVGYGRASTWRPRASMTSSRGSRGTGRARRR